MKIRAEADGDVATIRALTSAAFATARHSSGTEAAIIEALRDAGALTLSLVAERLGVIIGHVAFSRVTISGDAGGWFGLGPVSVQPALQRQGVGDALIRDGLARLQGQGAQGCVVLGDPAYYRRFGFESDPGLRYGDVPPAYFQRLRFSGATPHGEVAYHAGFDVSDPS
jgi:putative acetyltransferase